jgi:sigma-B regulation protein RsbU (phosphoserine phosphatase)
LGLGLYIASQIAIAHHGHLTVTSSEAETKFTLRFPLT